MLNIDHLAVGFSTGVIQASVTLS